MKTLTKFLNAVIVTTILSMVSLTSYAAGHGEKWDLVTDESSISFFSVKKGSVGEVHSFTDFSGVIDHNKASIEIKPDSVETGIPIRNERAREFLFETGVFPTISISSDVTEAMNSATKGQAVEANVPATLSMHGVTKEITLSVRIIRNSKKSISVASTKPVVIKAADYNMDGGVTKLAELVGGIPIASSVPVNFVLTFKKS